jgi:hypothetical protein
MDDNKLTDRIPTFAIALAGLFGFLMKYSAYNFLTGVALLCFAALAFAYITFIGPQVPFIRYLGFLIPMNSEGTTTLGASDILRVFSFLSLIFMILSIMGNALLRGLRKVVQPAARVADGGGSRPANPSSIRSSLRAAVRRIIIGFVAVSLFFAAAFAAVPYARMAEGASRLAMAALFGFFYLLAIVSNGVYLLTDVVSDFILSWARAKFPWPQERDQVM